MFRGKGCRKSEFYKKWVQNQREDPGMMPKCGDGPQKHDFGVKFAPGGSQMEPKWHRKLLKLNQKGAKRET